MAIMAGMPAGAARVVIGAVFGLVAELRDRHDVQDPVDAPVPGSDAAATTQRWQESPGGGAPLRG